MKTEKPILFSTEMVKAIFDGKKAQTRRVIGNPNCYPYSTANFRGLQTTLGYPASEGFTWAGFGNENDPLYYRCPYSQIGGKLWVRETWMPFGFVGNNRMFIHYKANYDQNGGERILEIPSSAKRPVATTIWRPSIFMPRWASRITLEVTDIRVQRVQEISETDQLAEGIIIPAEWYVNGNKMTAFGGLWDSINKKRGYGWDTNCWVWAISFKVIK
jgi:hypothetical protein